MSRARLCAVTAAALICVLAPAPAASFFSKPQSMPLTPKLIEIRETRVEKFVEEDPNSFTFPNEEPGLFLTFTIPIPDGLTLLELRQPENVYAQDNNSNDISNIEENFMGQLEYVKLKSSFGNAPTDFTFHTNLPARDASSISISTKFDAVFFSNIIEESMTAPTEWFTLPSRLTGNHEVKIKVAGKNKSINLHVRPGTSRSLFKHVTLHTSAGELESMGTMWNDNEAQFMFNGTFEDNMKLTLSIHNDLQTIPIGIRLENHPLP